MIYVNSNDQIYGGDFTEFCGLLRIYELNKFIWESFTYLLVHFQQIVNNFRQDWSKSVLQIIFFVNLFLLPKVFYFKGDTFCICYMVLLGLGAVHKSRRVGNMYLGGRSKFANGLVFFLKGSFKFRMNLWGGKKKIDSLFVLTLN